MPFTAPKSSKSAEKVLPPEGAHVARIYSLVEVGTIEGYEGRLQPKVRITFELPQTRHEFREDEGPKPFVITKKYTISVHEEAHLRKLLHSVEGKSLSDDEAEAFDLETLLGKTLQITISHKEGDRGKYAYVESASPLVAGTKAPKQVNESILLTYVNFDQNIFEGFPGFIQEEMRESLEYKEKFGSTAPDKDDIPFD